VVGGPVRPGRRRSAQSRSGGDPLELGGAGDLITAIQNGGQGADWVPYLDGHILEAFIVCQQHHPLGCDGGTITGGLSQPVVKMIHMSDQHEIRYEIQHENQHGKGDRDSSGEILVIDCETCSERDTSTCDDCIVTFLCARDPDDAVVVDLGEFRALRVLGESGLVPPLRHSHRT